MTTTATIQETRAKYRQENEERVHRLRLLEQHLASFTSSLGEGVSLVHILENSGLPNTSWLAGESNSQYTGRVLHIAPSTVEFLLEARSGSALLKRVKSVIATFDPIKERRGAELASSVFCSLLDRNVPCKLTGIDLMEELLEAAGPLPTTEAWEKAGKEERVCILFGWCGCGACCKNAANLLDGTINIIQLADFTSELLEEERGKSKLKKVEDFLANIGLGPDSN